jgi:mannose-6-phosphate isomerase-like protein (cupin superfamily)
MLTIAAVAATLGFASGVVVAQGKGHEAHHVSSETGKYVEVVPGASKCDLWGKEDGPHGSFTKFAPGTHHPMHTHKHDVRLVVLKGAYIYEPEHGEKVRVGPGEFIHIPGGLRHASGGDEKEGALFYESQDGKFDLTPVEGGKK